MSSDTVCRVCLKTDMNLYNVQNDLHNVYERIAREKYKQVGYPEHMCYICLTVLRKCQKFMKTARDTNNVLKQWYNQQNKVRVARPLYKYAISKPEFVTIDDEYMTFQIDVKVEKVESEQEAFQQECNTDVNIEETDTDVQTDYSELMINSRNDSTEADTVEDNNDTQTEPLFVDREDYNEISQLAHDNDALPIRKCKASNTKPQRQAPETSGETASNEISPLSSTPSQPYNLRHRNTNTKPTFRKVNRNSGEIGMLDKIVKTNAVRCKNKRLARNTIKNIKKSNKLSLNPSVLEKNKINTCNYKTTVQQHITRQITSRTDEKRFKCDVCNYKSIRKADLVQHIRTHSGVKPFKCNTCNYKCIHKSNLVEHLRSHTGVKPYTCNTCNYKCIKKSNLVRHMRTHTGVKLFKCSTCNYKCIQKSHLVRHMRTHTGVKPFKCSTCNYKCIQKSSLVRHMRTHTGVKLFKCNTCNYKCIQKSNLVRHMRTHTGEKPFACDICDYKCSQRHQLKFHLINKHVNKKRK